MFIKATGNRLLNVKFISDIFMVEHKGEWALYVNTVYPTFTDDLRITDYMKQEDAEKEFDRLERLLVKG